MGTTFKMKRFIPKASSLKENLEAFAAEHENDRHRLIVKVDPTGIGDACADYLEGKGFVVVRERDGATR